MGKSNKKDRQRPRAKELPPPTLPSVGEIGSLDLTKRQFAIVVAALAISQAEDLVLSDSVGSTIVGRKELDVVWEKLLQLAVDMEALDDETVQELLWQPGSRTRS